MERLAVIKMLVDSCAAVNLGPTKGLACKDIVMHESKCRVVTADGTVVKVDGVLRFAWDDPENEEIFAGDLELLIQMVNGAQDWLLSLPEKCRGGFRAYLNKRLEKSFLVFPNKFAVELTKEEDGCWSLQVGVYLGKDGNLRFGLAEGQLWKMVSEPVFEPVRKLNSKRVSRIGNGVEQGYERIDYESSGVSPSTWSEGDVDLDTQERYIAGDSSLRYRNGGYIQADEERSGSFDVESSLVVEELTWPEDDYLSVQEQQVIDGQEDLFASRHSTVGVEDGDLFVGVLRNATRDKAIGKVIGKSVLCPDCKQDVSSFVGKISCACPMEDGWCNQGLPSWVYEEGKINLGTEGVEYQTDRKSVV